MFDINKIIFDNHIIWTRIINIIIFLNFLQAKALNISLAQFLKIKILYKQILNNINCKWMNKQG